MKYIGLLSSAASGKLGGIVASHNRGGTYFRHHAVPVQPRTPAQTAVRNQLQGFSSAFKNLTPTQIAGWNALALTVTLKSKLGTTYNPTGQQLFVSLQQAPGRDQHHDLSAECPHHPLDSGIHQLHGVKHHGLRVCISHHRHLLARSVRQLRH